MKLITVLQDKYMDQVYVCRFLHLLHTSKQADKVQYLELFGILTFVSLYRLRFRNCYEDLNNREGKSWRRIQALHLSYMAEGNSHSKHTIGDLLFIVKQNGRWLLSVTSV